MESMTHLLTALKALLVLIAILYACIGQPLVVLNELRKDKGIQHRGLWFVATLIIGPFATVPFDMFFSEKKWVKQASDVAAVITIILCILYWKFGAGLGIA